MYNTKYKRDYIPTKKEPCRASLEVEEDCQHKLMNNCDKKSSGVVSNHLNWGGVKKNNSYLN